MSSERDRKTRFSDRASGRTCTNLMGVFRRKKGTSAARAGSQIAESDGSSKNSRLSEQSPTQIVHGHSDNEISDKAKEQSKDLWTRAYGALKIREEELVANYEEYLASDGSGHSTPANPSLNPELIETIVRRKLQDHEEDQWVVRLGTKSYKVRERGEKIIKFILWSKDFISTALSTQPYAALAWSGVSILLPLMLNSSQHFQTMADGLISISNILRLYRIKEDLYLQVDNRPARPEFVQAVVELYSNIFEYQARLVCFLSQRPLRRGFRGTFKLDDWEGMLEKVQTSDSDCARHCELYDKDEERRRYEAESSTMLKSVEIHQRVRELLETLPVQRHQGEQDELLRDLASGYKSDKGFVSERVPGTCEWFFEDDRFLEWRDSNESRLLWISAGPGCGKSVLAKALIDERRVCTDTIASTVCYFFFKDGQEQRTRGADALSALLHQLFRKNTTLITHALPSHKSYGKKLRDEFSELWEILVKSADSEAGEIICILDALDECEKTARDQLIKKIVHFFSQGESCRNSSLKLKFLVTSRPYDDLEQNFQRLSGVSTYMHFDGDDKSQRISQDINLVIDAKIPSIAGKFSDEFRDRISERLKKMDNRTYLWLFLTIDIIEQSPSHFRTKSSMNSLLENLPSEISDAYEKILGRSKDKVEARILLQLIVAATRPLSLEEANMALTIAIRGRSCRSQRDLDLYLLQDFKYTVQNICGLFVSVHDGKLFLIHQTAREFLLNTEEPPSHPGTWKGCLDMPAAQGILSRVCVTYLNFDDVASKSRGHLIQQGHSHEDFHLFEYASLNWPAHYVSQRSELAKDSRGAARSLCSTSFSQKYDWFEVYCNSKYLTSSNYSDLGIASLLGLIYVVEDVLNEGADVEAQGGFYGNALQIASLEGHDQVVQMLLDKGADVNAQGGYLGNALQAASLGGHDQVVQMLLDKGADVNAQGGKYGNALQAASLGGHDQVVQMLLDKGADVNAQGGYLGNALQAASSRGHDQVVQMLLDKGADVNAQGGEYGNALEAASQGGHDQVVQILLDKGVDVNAQGGFYGNALQAASLGGHDQVVQMLLDKEADVNAQGGFYGNALQAASLGGHDQVVQMLLDKGADVNAQGGYLGSALQAASQGGHDQVVQMLLDKGADVEAQGGFYGNALQIASLEGHDQVVQMLLDKEADVNAQGGFYGNALQAASLGGHDQVVQMLLDKEADVNAQGGFYGNALQAASLGGHDQVVQMLLDKGADVNAQGGKYGNALQAATKRRHNRVVRLLSNHLTVLSGEEI